MVRIIQIHDIHLTLRRLFLLIILSLPLVLNAQTDKKYIRKGNKEYENSKFSDSEISYRKAADANKSSPDAVFNVGDALYRQKKYDEASKQFEDNISQNDDKVKKSAGYYNLGNSLFEANKYQESIEAYKNALKLNPRNNQAKYNLAYAQDMLKKQQEQQKQQQDNKKNQDKDKNKKDQNKNQDQKEQEKNKDQQKDQNKPQDQKQQQQQPEKPEISKDDAQRLLNSVANDEKNVQEKVKLAKAAKAKVRTVKNW